jgi:hypothetical protein
MLEKAPIIGAWDKRAWGYLIHDADLVCADFNSFDKQLYQVAFEFK